MTTNKIVTGKPSKRPKNLRELSASRLADTSFMLWAQSKALLADYTADEVRWRLGVTAETFHRLQDGLESLNIGQMATIAKMLGVPTVDAYMVWLKCYQFELGEAGEPDGLE